MTAFFLILIYGGGALAMPDRKLGFWARVFWPERIGEFLHEKIRENDK